MTNKPKQLKQLKLSDIPIGAICIDTTNYEHAINRNLHKITDWIVVDKSETHVTLFADTATYAIYTNHADYVPYHQIGLLPATYGMQVILNHITPKLLSPVMQMHIKKHGLKAPNKYQAKAFKYSPKQPGANANLHNNGGLMEWPEFAGYLNTRYEKGIQEYIDANKGGQASERITGSGARGNHRAQAGYKKDLWKDLMYYMGKNPYEDIYYSDFLVADSHTKNGPTILIGSQDATYTALITGSHNLSIYIQLANETKVYRETDSNNEPQYGLFTPINTNYNSSYPLYI